MYTGSNVYCCFVYSSVSHTQVLVFNNSSEYMEHLDLVFILSQKKNLGLLGQRLYRMSLDLNIKKSKKES